MLYAGAPGGSDCWLSFIIILYTHTQYNNTQYQQVLRYEQGSKTSPPLFIKLKQTDRPTDRYEWSQREATHPIRPKRYLYTLLDWDGSKDRTWQGAKRNYGDATYAPKKFDNKNTRQERRQKV